MSAATSAEAVGIHTSVSAGEDVAAGLLDTRVTADVDVLSGVSFCCTAITIKQTIFFRRKCLWWLEYNSYNLLNMHAPTFNGLSGLIACTLQGLLCRRWCHAVSSCLCLGRRLSLTLHLWGCHKLLTLHLLHVPLLRGGLKLGSGIPHHSPLHHWHSFSGQQGALFL